jgi:predicted unusual protein kinase regulating ubiquinone biosynthesis (AarF/ABC1/UbiB family)
MSAPPVVRNARLVDTLVRLRSPAVRHLKQGQQGAWLADRLRMLGPTYIKVGQFISSRKDIFGAEFSKPFEALRDRAPPIAEEHVRTILEACQRRPLPDADRIANVTWQPMASASIGQVHRAVLGDGRQVVVKVKRPDVERTIREDMEFIGRVAELALALAPDKVMDAEQVRSGIADLRSYVLQETDFAREASNMQRFHDMYASDDFVRVPAPVLALCSADVIVMEYIESSPVGAQGTGPSAAADRRLANSVMDVFVAQLVRSGLVHGDPHPGNMGLDRDGRLVLYDFGNVIEVSRQDRQHLKELIFQLLVGNDDGVVRTVQKLGVRVLDRRGVVDYIAVYRDYMRTVDAAAFAAAVDPKVALPLQLTDSLVRLFRVYAMLEGTCKQLSPGFNYFDLLDDYIDELFFDEEFFSFKAQEDVAAVSRALSGVGSRLARRIARGLQLTPLDSGEEEAGEQTKVDGNDGKETLELLRQALRMQLAWGVLSLGTILLMRAV